MIVGTKKVNYRLQNAPRIVQVVFNVDFRQQHHGLKKTALEAGIKLEKPEDGAIICFINSKRNKIKFLTPNNTPAYYKSPDGRRIDLSALNFINTAFLIKGEIDYDSALQKSLEERLGMAGRPRYRNQKEERARV